MLCCQNMSHYSSYIFFYWSEICDLPISIFQLILCNKHIMYTCFTVKWVHTMRHKYDFTNLFFAAFLGAVWQHFLSPYFMQSILMNVPYLYGHIFNSLMAKIWHAFNTNVLLSSKHVFSTRHELLCVDPP